MPISATEPAKDVSESLLTRLGRRAARGQRPAEAGLLVVIVLIGLLLTFGGGDIEFRGRTVNNFLRVDNIVPNVATPMAAIAIMAVGATIVIISGGIDLSVGSVMAASALVAAATIQVTRAEQGDSGFSAVAMAVGAAVATGALCGLLNGALIVALRIHPFIVTLGTLYIFRGVVNVAVPMKTLPPYDKGLPTAFTDHFMAWKVYFGRTPAADAVLPIGLAEAIAWLTSVVLAVIVAALLLGWAAQFAAWMWRRVSGFVKRGRAELRDDPAPDASPPAFLTIARLAAAMALKLLIPAIFVWLAVYAFVLYYRASPEFFVQPTPMLVMLGCIAFFWVYLNHTIGGRQVYIVGGNEEAARFSGLPVAWIKIRVYILAGALAGLAGVVSLGYNGSVSTNTATGYELTVIAAAVVGGASLLGGRGTALGALLGALVIQLIDNGTYVLRDVNLGFTKLTLSKEYAKIINGAAIVVAVAVDRLSVELNRRQLARQGGTRGGAKPVGTEDATQDQSNQSGSTSGETNRPTNLESGNTP